MLAVSVALPTTMTDRPPVILVHGSVSSAQIWTFWRRELTARGWPTYAVDLRGHGHSDRTDLSHISMHDYAADVRSLAGQLRQPPVVIGWSMGGLVAMMVTAAGDAAACVGLAPSVPARQVDASLALRVGEFGAEEYGITSSDPEEQPTMPDLDREERVIALASLGRDSRSARDERKAGIIIESLPRPLLIVTGTADRLWPRERYDDLWLEADQITVDGASHWGLVLNRRALATTIPEVLRWLNGVGV